jgi:polar amino acid transport system substrate-binding protein
MRKVPVITAVAAFALTVPLNAAASDDLELLVPGELSVATEGTFPPFSMIEGADGDLDGLEIRLMREIANRLDLEYNPVIIAWDSMLVGLFAGQYDLVSAAMDITEERQEQVLFSDGWLESGGRLLVHESSDIEDIDQIDGLAVGVLVASTWAALAEEAGAGRVATYNSESDAIQDLINQNIDGVITDAIAGAYAIESGGLPLRMAEGYLSRIQKGWPTAKDRPNLIRAINETLAEMIEDGTYAELTTDLIGFSPAPEEPIPSNF